MIRRIWLPFVLSMVFVFSQTASLLHAQIHPFHEHTEECDVYEMLAQPTSSPAHVELATSPIWRVSNVFTLAVQTPRFSFSPVYSARAPPAA